MRRIKARIKPEAVIDAVLAHAAANAPTYQTAADDIFHQTAALAAAGIAALSKSHAEAERVFDQASAAPVRAYDEKAETDARWNRYLRLREAEWDSGEPAEMRTRSRMTVSGCAVTKRRRNTASTSNTKSLPRRKPPRPENYA